MSESNNRNPFAGREELIESGAISLSKGEKLLRELEEAIVNMVNTIAMVSQERDSLFLDTEDIIENDPRAIEASREAKEKRIEFLKYLLELESNTDTTEKTQIVS